jgi:hypothetical protein
LVDFTQIGKKQKEKKTNKKQFIGSSFYTFLILIPLLSNTTLIFRIFKPGIKLKINDKSDKIMSSQRKKKHNSTNVSNKTITDSNK